MIPLTETLPRIKRTNVPAMERRRKYQRLSAKESATIAVGDDKKNGSILTDLRRSGRSALGSLVGDVLVYILSFMTLDEKDNFAVVSRPFWLARNHCSVDPTRTGTLLIRDWGTAEDGCCCRWTAMTLLHELETRSFKYCFVGNRTRLRVIGLEKVRASKMVEVTSISRRMKWEHVTSLDISFPRGLDPRLRKVKNSVCKSLAMVLPNLRVLDMNNVKVTETAANAFAKHCPDLEVFRWKGSDDGLKLNGENLANCSRLKEIDLEGSKLYCSIRQSYTTPRTYDPKSEEFLEALRLFRFCSSNRLERVNIKGCRWYSGDVIIEYSPERGVLVDIPEEAMIRFVQNTPSLKRFESNLPSGTIAKLRLDHPNVTFR